MFWKNVYRSRPDKKKRKKKDLFEACLDHRKRTRGI